MALVVGLPHSRKKAYGWRGTSKRGTVPRRVGSGAPYLRGLVLVFLLPAKRQVLSCQPHVRLGSRQIRLLNRTAKRRGRPSRFLAEQEFVEL